jgi:hypothetical protein
VLAGFCTAAHRHTENSCVFFLRLQQVETYNTGMYTIKQALSRIEEIEELLAQQPVDIPTVREQLAELADTLHEAIENAGK